MLPRSTDKAKMMLSRIARIARIAPGVYRAAQPAAVRPVVVLGQKRWASGVAAPPAGGLQFLPVEEVTQRVLSTIQAFDKVTKTVGKQDHFTNDLGLDSLDVVEMVMALEEQFGIDMSNQDAEKIHSVQDAIDFFCKHPQSS